MADCDFCIGVDADSFGYIYKSHDETTMKAEKEEKCCECMAIIPVGSEYIQFVGGYCDDECACDDDDDENDDRCDDGYQEDRFITCPACHGIREAYSCDKPNPCHTSLWESIYDVWQYGQPLKMAGECWDKLSAAGKAKMVERWNEFKLKQD